MGVNDPWGLAKDPWKALGAAKSIKNVGKSRDF
jgi:hypothetical protein